MTAYRTPLPDDVLARARRDFPATRHAEVIAALEGLAAATREHARVARCVLFVANRDLEQFERMVALAHTDYRDAIVQAEYDRNDRRLRDLSEPFEDGDDP
jgi:hypothetical protein